MLELHDKLALFEQMAWAKPLHTREAVNAAALAWINRDYKRDSSTHVIQGRECTFVRRYTNELDIINNWRSAHSYPLNTIQNNLRRNARQVNSHVLIAQRIKRLSSIEAKLARFPEMKLSQIQDIGGCRAIFVSLDEVRQLEKIFIKGRLKHKITKDDYIDEPRESGYRGIHLKCKFHSDSRPEYNDLKIEIQIRTTIQHAWATAVETVDTFTSQKLKSGRGTKDWNRFFQLMATAMAVQENTPPVPNTPSNAIELKKELKHYRDSLSVLPTLRAFNTIVHFTQNAESASHYFVLEANAETRSTSWRGYDKKRLEIATADLLETEKRLENSEVSNVVLVSVDSVALLKESYPNYFADTARFMYYIEEATK